MAERTAKTPATCDKRRGEVTLINKPFICRECRTMLGFTDGSSLSLGTVILEKIVTLKCAGCGAVRVWRPVGKKGKSNG